MEAVFTFNSTRSAIEGERALLAAGLPVRIAAKPTPLGADCGFSIFLDEGDLEAAKNILAEEGLDWAGVWRKSRAGPSDAYSRLTAP